MKKALIVVDYQNDFVNGALGFEGAEKLDDIICEKIQQYRKEGGHIIFTFDTHEANYLNTMEGKNLPVEHCIKGTEGHKLYGRTAKMVDFDSYIFDKPTFGSLELAVFLKAEGYDVVELCGLVSSICVLSNAVMAKAALPESQIIVDSKATSSFDMEMNIKALDILKNLHITVL